MNNITPVQNTNNIRYADFVRIISPDGTYLLTTASYAITVPAVSATAFTAASVLMKVGDVQRDIKSTANETTVSLSGIDTSTLGFVLGQNIKGSKIEMWHGFFNTSGALITTGGTGGLYQFFSGYITSFSITENWMEEVKAYLATITVSASSTQLILQNRIAGRYTNNNSWQFFAPGDTSMNRVGFIETINYYFGKDAPADS
jgi:hypothetical protein